MKNSLPIFEVTNENFEAMWPAIRSAIESASFIALDCEMSGLGDRRKLNCREIDIRFTNTSKIAKDYSIVSLGVSCFSCQSFSSFEVDSENVGKENLVRSHNYLVQTFNILTLCSPTYIVEFASLKFLASHGFDFNKQYSHGLPYCRGEEKQIQHGDEPIVRDIFTTILKHKKPIVLHNGFVDLVFLYQAFYADLPKKSETFAADLNEMFPYGIYDTKYIAEYHEELPATYLEYVFKKLQLENEVRCEKGDWHVNLSFPPYPSDTHGLKWHPYRQVHDYVKENELDLRDLCDSYMYHGWCSKGHNCAKSHQIDRIVRELTTTKIRKRKSDFALSSIADVINAKMQKIKVNEKCGQKIRTRLRKRSSISKNKGDADNEDVSGYESPSQTSHNTALYSNGTSSSLQQPPSNNSNFNRNGLNEVKLVSSNCDGPIATHNFDVINENGSFNSPLVTRCKNSTLSLNMNYEKESSLKSSCSDRNKIMNERCYKMESAGTEGGGTKAYEHGNVTTKQQEVCSGHRAGFDAFMTGFIFACNVTSMGSTHENFAFDCAKSMNMQHLVSRVYLISKGFPFLVRSSNYSSTSPSHNRIIKTIRDCDP